MTGPMSGKRAGHDRGPEHERERKPLVRVRRRLPLLPAVAHDLDEVVVVVDRQDVIARSSQDRSGSEELVFRARPVNPRAVRRFVREALEAASAPADVVADFQLVVSELATNAIEHGVGDVVVEVDGSRPAWWEVTVSSSIGGARLRSTREWVIADADAGSGRGLGIVRWLMDEVRVDHVGDRISVRCRMRR